MGTHFFPNYAITHGPGVHANFRHSKSLAALDRYGLKLADLRHNWSPKERGMFEQRVRELQATGDAVSMYGTRKK